MFDILSFPLWVCGQIGLFMFIFDLMCLALIELPDVINAKY